MSPRIKVDLTEATSFDPVPDDTYLAEVTEVGAVAKGPKAAYIPLTLDIVENEDPSLNGRKLFTNLVIEGKGAGIFASFWEKATGEEIDLEEGSIDVDTDDLLGTRVAVVTKQKEYPEDSGEFRSEVKKVLRAQAAEPAAAGGGKKGKK